MKKTANKKNQKAQAEKARLEHMAKCERRNKAYVLARARELDYKRTAFLVEACEKGYLTISDELLEKELTEIWNKNKEYVHEEHYDHFMTYGSFIYSNYRGDGKTCIACGEPLMCAGKRRKHSYKELSQEECRKRDIYHGGNCFHVSECVKCGHISSVDSSG